MLPFYETDLGAGTQFVAEEYAFFNCEICVSLVRITYSDTAIGARG